MCDEEEGGRSNEEEEGGRKVGGQSALHLHLLYIYLPHCSMCVSPMVESYHTLAEKFPYEYIICITCSVDGWRHQRHKMFDLSSGFTRHIHVVYI